MRALKMLEACKEVKELPSEILDQLSAFYKFIEEFPFTSFNEEYELFDFASNAEISFNHDMISSGLLLAEMSDFDLQKVSYKRAIDALSLGFIDEAMIWLPHTHISVNDLRKYAKYPSFFDQRALAEIRFIAEERVNHFIFLHFVDFFVRWFTFSGNH